MSIKAWAKAYQRGGIRGGSTDQNIRRLSDTAHKMSDAANGRGSWEGPSKGAHRQAAVAHEKARDAARVRGEETLAKTHATLAREHHEAADNWDESKHSRDEAGKFS